MPQNTHCHLDSAYMGHTCPNGKGFEVKQLETNGGTRVCANPSCPHQIRKTSKTVVELVGNERCIVVSK